MIVIYGFITFWCGIKSLAGHGSCNYLTKMKEAWLDVLRDYDEDEYKRIEKINTKSLIAGQILGYKRENEQIVEQYAFDIIFDGGFKKQYLETLFKMKFKDLLNPALIEIYNSYVPVDKRIELTIKPMDLMGKEFNWI